MTAPEHVRTAETVVERPEGEEPPHPRQEFMGGLAKGLHILESFNPHTPQLTVATAAHAAGLSPAAARRCLRTLESLGYLSYDGKYYRPTARLARLASSYLSASPLPLLAQPHLAAVRDAIGESISLGILDGQSVTFVARAEARQVITTGVRIGSHMPAHASAAGRVFLSAMSDDVLQEYLEGCEYTRTGPNTLLTLDLVRDRVERARHDGFAFTDEELQPGVRSIAVPVRDATGIVRATLSVATTSSRETLPRMEQRYLPVLQTEADRLGAKI